MGGNAASLRFDAVMQRGSRDNDHLTITSHQDIERLMSAYADHMSRFDNPAVIWSGRYTLSRPGCGPGAQTASRSGVDACDCLSAVVDTEMRVDVLEML